MIKQVIWVMAMSISAIFSYERYCAVQRILLWPYTFWVAQCFLRFGKNSKILGKIRIFGSKSISIGDWCYLCNDIELTAMNTNSLKNEVIHIGDRVSIGNGTRITAIDRVVIGNGVLFGTNVFVSDHSHGRNIMKAELGISPSQRDLFSKGSVEICDNVWIGNNAVILSGVRIGIGAIIGANSVVNIDIPDYSVAAGVPVKVLRRNLA